MKGLLCIYTMSWISCSYVRYTVHLLDEALCDPPQLKHFGLLEQLVTECSSPQFSQCWSNKHVEPMCPKHMQLKQRTTFLLLSDSTYVCLPLNLNPSSVFIVSTKSSCDSWMIFTTGIGLPVFLWNSLFTSLTVHPLSFNICKICYLEYLGSTFFAKPTLGPLLPLGRWTLSFSPNTLPGQLFIASSAW